MLNLLGLLFICFPSDSVPSQQFYYYKDSVITEIISINKSGFYESYKKSTLPHTLPFYSQGYYESNGNIYTLRPGIVDSLALTVKELEIKMVNNKYFFERKVKIVGDKNNLKELYSFNYDHLNQVSYDMDIKLCMEDINGTKYFKRLNKEALDFEEIVTEYRPRSFYIMLGGYIITQKWVIKNSQSNAFEISLSKNELFRSFKDFYLANHKLEQNNGQLKDLMTDRIYISFIPETNKNRIDEIASSLRTYK